MSTTITMRQNRWSNIITVLIPLLAIIYMVAVNDAKTQKVLGSCDNAPECEIHAARGITFAEDLTLQIIYRFPPYDQPLRFPPTGSPVLLGGNDGGREEAGLSFGQGVVELFVAGDCPFVSNKKVGSDVLRKMAYSHEEAIKVLTCRQTKIVEGLIDHESAGTWSETVKGDGGLAKGIAQWHVSSGRSAAPTYEGQVKQIIKEMKLKFARYPEELAITAHNCPRCAARGQTTPYTANVYLSANQFGL